MPGEIPNWDIVPELGPEEILPISEDANHDWCMMVNYLYAGRNYQTQILTDHYTRSKVSPNGQIMNGKYQLAEIKDDSGEIECHTFVGVLLRVEMRPDYRPGRDEFGGMKKVPFAHLAFAEDLDSGHRLSESPQHRVLVPLTKTSQLFLEKR